eukprot:COSAG01_NODE_440_length_17033_cov_16.301110_12_plen_481_part_00
MTAAPALPLAPPAATEAAADEEAGDGVERDGEARTADAVLLAGAELIQTAAAASAGQPTPDAAAAAAAAAAAMFPPRVVLPGEADTAEVATLSRAVDACASAAEQLQAASAGCGGGALCFGGRVTSTANFLRDVGLHALGEAALRRLPEVAGVLQRIQQQGQGQGRDSAARPSSRSWLPSFLRARGDAAAPSSSPPREDSAAAAAAAAAAGPRSAAEVEREATRVVTSLTALSSSMVARFYAQTYVTMNDTEAPVAWQLAEQAVTICRSAAAAAAAAADDDGGVVDGGGESESMRALLAEALHHCGVASASCAQVSHFCACIGSPCLRFCVHGASMMRRGLGILRAGEGSRHDGSRGGERAFPHFVRPFWLRFACMLRVLVILEITEWKRPGQAAWVPPAADIFRSGDAALREAIGLREAAGDELLSAMSVAARAELYYCAASANTRGAGAFEQAAVGELVGRSVELNREAVERLEADGW